MKVSNKNIINAARLILTGLFFVAALDVALSFVDGPLGNFFRGYTAMAYPVLLVGFYMYIGFPIFTINTESEIVRIKSHIAFGEFLGKELKVHRTNILSLEIDNSGIRKKLVVKYLKDGKELIERFSVTILSERKLKMLINAIENINSEKSQKSLHLFI